MLDIKRACASLLGGIITNFNIDVFQKNVELKITVNSNSNIVEHILQINDYDSFFWLEKDDFTDKSYKFSNCNYFEFSEMTLRNFSVVTNDTWLKQFALDFNICIEIWESAFLLKTNSIIIDGQNYLIGQSGDGYVIDD